MIFISGFITTLPPNEMDRTHTHAQSPQLASDLHLVLQGQIKPPPVHHPNFLSRQTRKRNRSLWYTHSFWVFPTIDSSPLLVAHLSTDRPIETFLKTCL